MSFWSKASTEQKLAQIDGAIALGLTSKQCGMNCGAADFNIRYFAAKHGRTFSMTGEEATRKRALNGLKSAPIINHMRLRQKWERTGFSPVNMASARIFPDEHVESLFDPLPCEEEVAFA